MQILKAKYIITCDNDFNILKNSCVAFNKRIVAVGNESEMRAKFKDADFTDLGNVVITPALVNSHVHLEFSSNRSELIYGDFITWLGSIVANGAKIAKKCTQNLMAQTLKNMMKSGVGTIGAISSYGKDLQILALSSARVIFFNEILGSNGEFVEQNFLNFMLRFNESVKYKNEHFTPALSLHSPYSVHPNLAKKALKFAHEKGLIVSTHFLESKAERQWLEKGNGKFKEHLKHFVPEPKPMYEIDEYLSLFNGIRTLFTHCVYVDNFTKFDKDLHSITHCVVSNRLLGKKSLNLNQISKQGLTLNIGTDGLSSNISLNLWDELRAVLLTHSRIELNKLAKVALIAATRGGARALGLQSGEITVGKLADIAVFTAPKCDTDTLLTQLILHTKLAKRLYIGGEICKF
ncbi:metal-dependent hydrolase [Campylobacter sp. faydin G-105]|uniref:aminofutalosine deaminase family hydrolase n=1 Tax=Campylobacter anatolicus TaxID=2829105 RepID=UPI001BA39CE3|nr:metal-dependent hydrolase [Campylobacter anatolicus]MBR8461915.1 metal-dependent hydrolase [Campylobacter anatolicus]